MNPLQFNPSDPFTIGVELELQLLDKETYDLAPFGPQILGKVQPQQRDCIKAEFIQSMVEISTPVCQDMIELSDTLASLCRQIEILSEEVGCMFYSASLHPFALHRDQLLTTNERYAKIMAELQLLGRRFIAQTAPSKEQS